MKRTPSFMAGMLGSKAYLEPSPLGTVGIIAPWNFPVGMIFILQPPFWQLETESWQNHQNLRHKLLS